MLASSHQNTNSFSSYACMWDIGLLSDCVNGCTILHKRLDSLLLYYESIILQHELEHQFTWKRWDTSLLGLLEKKREALPCIGGRKRVSNSLVNRGRLNTADNDFPHNAHNCASLSCALSVLGPDFLPGARSIPFYCIPLAIQEIRGIKLK